MFNEMGAVLVAEVGSSITRVTLVDTVANEARLIGQAEVTSTIEPPYENALIGILEATAQISGQPDSTTPSKSRRSISSSSTDSIKEGC